MLLEQETLFLQKTYTYICGNMEYILLGNSAFLSFSFYDISLSERLIECVQNNCLEDNAFP